MHFIQRRIQKSGFSGGGILNTDLFSPSPTITKKLYFCYNFYSHYFLLFFPPYVFFYNIREGRAHPPPHPSLKTLLFSQFYLCTFVDEFAERSREGERLVGKADVPLRQRILRLQLLFLYQTSLYLCLYLTKICQYRFFVTTEV